MKNKELFRNCLVAWGQYSGAFDLNIGKGIKAFRFNDKKSLLYIEFRLLDELNTNSLALLERNSPREVYFNTMSDERADTLEKLEACNADFKLEGSMGFNIWHKLVEAKPFENLQFSVGKIDSDIFSEYKQTLREQFDLEDDYIANLNRSLLLKAQGEHDVFLVKDGNVLVATACCLTYEGVGWLFSGCIHPDYREQGLWKYLVHLRQKHSLKYGAKMWFLQTQNNLIAGKCDEFFEIDCFIQDKKKVGVLDE